MTEQSTTETPSASALRARRSRYHAKGDHNLCLPQNCRYAPTPTSTTEDDLAETLAEIRLVGDKLTAGIPGLTVYPDGDPSFDERENPAPEPDPDDLLTILRTISGSSGLASQQDRKINAVIQAVDEFDVTLPPEVGQAALRLKLARRRQAELRSAQPRTFNADDLLADDWQSRLSEVLTEAATMEGKTWEPVVRTAVARAAANLGEVVTEVLPMVTKQVEQWLRDNQQNLARFSLGGGNITPNQAAEWESWAAEVFRFAERQADAGGGGRVHELQAPARTWLLLWEWTPAQWAELSDKTKPGRDLKRGDTFFGVALAIGAKVSFARSVSELKGRYNELTLRRSSFYGSMVPRR